MNMFLDEGGASSYMNFDNDQECIDSLQKRARELKLKLT